MMMEENHHTKKIIEKKKTAAKEQKNQQLIPKIWRAQKDINAWLTSLDLYHLAMLFEYHNVTCLSVVGPP
jgi:NADH:ubiquinone oxidoreductase subunit E